MFMWTSKRNRGCKAAYEINKRLQPMTFNKESHNMVKVLGKKMCSTNNLNYEKLARIS